LQTSDIHLLRLHRVSRSVPSGISNTLSRLCSQRDASICSTSWRSLRSAMTNFSWYSYELMNDSITSKLSRSFSCISRQSPSVPFTGVEFESLGDIEMRSASKSRYTVAFVSTVVWASTEARNSCASDWRRGSPPVNTTCSALYFSTRSSTWSMLSVSPSGFQEVYAESHHEQRRLHPLVRTKTDGVPASIPSPWTE